MLAVMILVVLTVVVYQFTDTTLSTARVSIEMADHDAAYGGMRRLLDTQLSSIPASETGAFVGVNIRGKGAARRDMLQLVCPAGNAVLTPDAKGFYQITLGVRDFPRGSNKFYLGMQREPWTSDEEDDAADDEDANGKPGNKATTNRAPKAELPADWIPLVPGVVGLELAYFDARLNGWVDKWTDQGALPNLVRMRMLSSENQPPYEIVARVPGGGSRQKLSAPVNIPPPAARRIPKGSPRSELHPAPRAGDRPESARQPQPVTGHPCFPPSTAQAPGISSHPWQRLRPPTTKARPPPHTTHNPQLTTLRHNPQPSATTHTPAAASPF